MRRLIVFIKGVFCLCLVYHAVICNGFAQTIVGKVLTDRQLTWLDFEGKADTSSPYSASTGWSVNYRSHVDSFHDDTAFLSFRIAAVFNNYLSWVKRERIKKRKTSEELLSHEQGHYNIAIACAETLREAFHHSLFLKSNYAAAADSIADVVIAYFTAMEDQYDIETSHMLNRNKQKEWNDLITGLLMKDPGICIDKK